MSLSPLGGRIRYFQATDAAGRPAQAEYLLEVPVQGLRSVTETAMDVLRSLSPRETEHEGVFWYTAPQGETGWLRLEGFRPVNSAEVQQAVRTLEISAAIGQREPIRQEVLSIGTAIVPRTSNPYVKIFAGAGALALATWGFTSVLLMPSVEGGELVALVVLALLGLAGIVLAITGFARRAWWHRARAEARRRNVGLPDQLRFWN